MIMKMYSISHLSKDESTTLIEKFKKRRKEYWLISIFVLIAPISFGFALYCDDIILFLEGNLRIRSSKKRLWLYGFLGLGFSLFIAYLSHKIKWISNAVLGVKLLK